jgi:hypothetical protein
MEQQKENEHGLGRGDVGEGQKQEQLVKHPALSKGFFRRRLFVLRATNKRPGEKILKLIKHAKIDGVIILINEE